MIFLLDFDFATLGHVRKLFLLLETGRRELSAQPFFCFVAKGFAGLREQGYAIACADWDGGVQGSLNWESTSIHQSQIKWVNRFVLLCQC